MLFFAPTPVCVYIYAFSNYESRSWLLLGPIAVLPRNTWLKIWELKQNEVQYFEAVVYSRFHLKILKLEPLFKYKALYWQKYPVP